MIQRVYEQVRGTVDEVCVATDDERIEKAVKAFGGNVVMTSHQHKSGTDRCYEAYQKAGGNYDVVINIQGDEPFIQPQQIETIKSCFTDGEVQIATLVKPFRPDDDFEKVLFNPNSPKVVFNKRMEALYFSRSMIPFLRSGGVEAPVYLHWGIYAYRREVLEKFVSLPPGRLENCEKLEQLRALENGIRIYVLLSDLESIGVDTPADLAAAEKKLRETK